jgi:TRAP transporter 4TM/12TM fusion protein
VKAGLYYLLPVIVLVWCLTVERLSPGLSALYASVFMLFVLLTQKALKSFLRKSGEDVRTLLREGVTDTLDGMIAGSRNMIGIGVATAAAGLVVGTITLTGVGLVMAEIVEFISGGYVLPMLLFTAILSLILGMGLPTTANYIVVSSLMAPVIVTVGAQSGLIVPLVAVHMFVFYFGILADDTPPVAMAAFAAAAISGGDPIRTGIQGFCYDIRTAILPFMFIFNTELLMIGIETWYLLLSTIITAVIAMLLFAAGTQGFFLTKSKLWETFALILVAFTLFRPGFWMDMIYPPLESVPATEIYEIAESMPEDAQIRIRVTGEDLEERKIDKIVMLPLGPKASGKDRLMNAGLELRFEDGKAIVDNIVFGSTAERQKIDFDYEIPSVQKKADRPPRQLFYIPALALLGLIVMLQLRRRSRLEPATA